MNVSPRYASWATVSSFAVLSYYYHTPTDLITPDSSSYLTFDASRTVGYPIFLWVVQKLTGSLNYLPVIQLGLFSVACGFLVRRVGWLGMIAAPLLMFQPYVIQSHFEVLTESLSLTLTILTIGVWIDAINCSRRADIFKLSALIGLAILVRPSAYALLVFLGFAVAQRRFFIEAFAPVFAALLIGSFANYVNHGFFCTQSFLGLNLMGKVTFAMRDSANTPEPEKYRELVRNVKPIQDYVSLTSTRAARTIFTVGYYDVVRYDIMPQIFPNDRDWDSTWTQMAFAVLRDNPKAYVADVLTTYEALWTFPQMMTPDQAGAVQKFVEVSPPPRFARDTFNFSLSSHSSKFLMVLRSLYAFSFILSLYFLFRYRHYPIEAGLSVMIHAHYLLIAGIQAPIGRYSVIAWPCIVVLNSLFLQRLILIARQKHAKLDAKQRQISH